MKEIPKLLSHNSVYRQDDDYELSFDEIRERYLPDIGSKDLVASDMDGSMFENDLGILVFLEQLSQPDDWPFDPEEFGQLLVPESYEAVLNLGSGRCGRRARSPICRRRYPQLRDSDRRYEGY